MNDINRLHYTILNDPSNANDVRKRLWVKGSDTASAGSVTIPTDGNFFHITGTTTITAFSAVNSGYIVKVVFDGVLTLTHNGTSFILPGGTDILTAAGDSATFVNELSGNWRCISFSPASNSVPIGTVSPYSGTAAPGGWLLCFGQVVSRTTYSGLFAVVSTTYNTGGEAGTDFRLPDLRGRVVAGQDDMGGSSANRLTNQSGGLNGDTLGATGGSETATVEAHTHSIPSLSVSVSTNITRILAGAGAVADGISYGSSDGVDTKAVTDVLPGFSGTGSTGTGTTGSTGSGSAHNNVQPTLILNYIIKT
jgi:microcystin-dependent protein